MRISDWSSDVCPSDLSSKREREVMMATELNISLSEGSAANMGDGLYLVRQEAGGEKHCVSLTVADMHKMLQNALGCPLEGRGDRKAFRHHEESERLLCPLQRALGDHSLAHAA